jgi:RNA polymerase sigma factor (sigma-70 family)
MRGDRLRRLADFFWRAAAPPKSESISDGELLTRFAELGDRDAFAALVGRHGALVWGVCGRVLRHFHDREEAFSATFLILARRAVAVRRRESVRSWLYGVAVRVATRARADSHRRGTEPLNSDLAQAASGPEEVAQQRELREVIDEAVARLPERQRLAVVLTYFAGKTNDEAANLLGCPRGTVATLLARARERLRRRLVRNGLAPAAGGLCWIGIEGTAPAAVPDLVAASMVGAAVAMRLGLAAEAALPTAASLAEGVMRSMFISKSRMAAGVMTAVLVAGLGVGIWRQPSADGQPLPPAAEPPTVPSSGATAPNDEAAKLREQIRLAELLVESAKKRLKEVETPRTAPPAANFTPLPKYPSTPAPPVASGSGAPGFPFPIVSANPEDRLRKIERLAEELRREVEALRRDMGRNSTPTATPPSTPNR